MTYPTPHSFRTLIAAAITLGTASAMAQPMQAFSADSPFMLGDLAGARTEMGKSGLFFGLFYVTEFATNAKGGYNEDRVTERSDQTTALLNYSLMPKHGIDGEFSIVITNRNNGDLLSLTRLNDPRTGTLPNLSQEVWGYGSVSRLTRLTYNQHFADRTLRVRVGKMTPTEEFYPTTLGCEFQSLINCGAVPGVSSIWYGWPISTWSAMGEVKFNSNWYARAGVYEQNPDTTKTSRGFSLSNRGAQGQIVPVLVGWRPSVGEKKMAGNYFAGVYYSNVKSADLSDSSVQRNSKKTLWAYGEQQVTGPGGDSPQGLRLFASAVVNDSRTEVLQKAYGAGFYYMGLFDSRPQDMLGFSVAAVKINDRFTASRAAVNLANGLVGDFSSHDYLPLGSREVTAELFYRMNLAKWISVQPSIQFIKAPGAIKQVPSATVFGLRMNVAI
ncbi:carbohydrate porin [Roseateles sp. LYH14W]|uniref:Carbohydrate porin n=2 Tax=Pelomonas parva TaxID=3299032 RepID=A0ABW7F8N0_9BURK